MLKISRIGGPSTSAVAGLITRGSRNSVLNHWNRGMNMNMNVNMNLNRKLGIRAASTYSLALSSTNTNNKRDFRYYLNSKQTSLAHFYSTSTNNDEIKKEYAAEDAAVKEEINGEPITKEFQAHTRKLLDIVTHSLYSEKEVFIRELISNASDALEKVRFLQTKGESIADSSLPLEIRITIDEKEGLFTIQDTGIGMTEEDLTSNLGTIAHSGSEKFLKELSETDSQVTKESIIGRFGVGFYSAFMVADNVRVFTKNAKMDSDDAGFTWYSDGSGSYQIAPAANVNRGTKIVLRLNENALQQFASKTAVRDIIKKYSNFVSFPIYLNGEQVNTVQPLWTLPKDKITPENHKEFFRYLTQSGGEPLYHLHYTSDSPLSIRSIFYIPSSNPENVMTGLTTPGVHLYSRRVLIQSDSKDLLPRYLRFVKGVCDSEDIPLNLSRELLQNGALVSQLKKVVTNRLIRWIDEESKRNPLEYNTKFYPEFGNYIREGIISDLDTKDKLGPLLRFRTSKEENMEHMISLAEYVERMPEEQKHIYFLAAPSYAVFKQSPYLEPFLEHGYEVLFLDNKYDEICMRYLANFKGKSLLDIATDNTEVEFKKKDEANSSEKKDSLTKEETDELLDWMRNSLGELVGKISVSKRLVSYPAIVVGHQAEIFRELFKISNKGEMPMEPQSLEVNPDHPVIKKLNDVRKDDEARAKIITRQIYDNALIAAGLVSDPREMLGRLNSLVKVALGVNEEPKASDSSTTETPSNTTATDTSNPPESN